MKALATLSRTFGVPFLFLALAVRLAVIPWSSINEGIWVDTDVYAMGGRVLASGGDLYSALSAEQLPFTYAPFAAVLFVPLGMLPPDLGHYSLLGCSILCFLAVAFVLMRRLQLSPWKALSISIFFIGLEPMVRNLLLGQVNMILMCLVVADHLLVPYRFRGILTGVAAGIKITPAAFIILFLLRRDWRNAILSGIGFLATIAIGGALAPDATARYWGGGFIGLDKFGSAAVLGSDNQSLLACWMRLTGDFLPETGVKVVALVIGIGMGAFAAYLEYRSERPDAAVAALGWVALGALLGSPVSWSHHWVWWLVPLTVLTSRRRARLAIPLTLVMWFPTIWTIGPGDFRELLFTTEQKIISFAYCIIGVIALIYAGSSALRHRKPTSANTSNDPQEAREGELSALVTTRAV